MGLEYLKIQSKACVSLCFSASPPQIGYLSRGKLSSSNSLPPVQEKTSNARGMPGVGMFKLQFDWYITCDLKILLGKEQKCSR